MIMHSFNFGTVFALTYAIKVEEENKMRNIINRWNTKKEKYKIRR
jgi:hypothetical protein